MNKQLLTCGEICNLVENNQVVYLATEGRPSSDRIKRGSDWWNAIFKILPSASKIEVYLDDTEFVPAYKTLGRRIGPGPDKVTEVAISERGVELYNGWLKLKTATTVDELVEVKK